MDCSKPVWLRYIVGSMVNSFFSLRLYLTVKTQTLKYKNFFLGWLAYTQKRNHVRILVVKMCGSLDHSLTQEYFKIDSIIVLK